MSEQSRGPSRNRPNTRRSAGAGFRVLYAVLLLGCGSIAGALLAPVSSQGQSLGSIQSKLGAARGKLQHLRGREQVLTGDISGLSHRIGSLERQIGALRQE